MDWWHKISLKYLWFNTILDRGASMKDPASLLMLVSWELWNERNARVFRNTAASATIVTARIKEEAHLWALAICVL